MEVSNRIPKPKNTDKLRPMAASDLMRDLAVIQSMVMSESQPVKQAPKSKSKGFLESNKMNAPFQ